MARQGNSVLTAKPKSEEYFIEFLNAYKRAKFPIGSTVIPTAWKAAQEQRPPQEANQFENPQLRLLVSLCRELQRVNGSEPFYVSCRTVQKLFQLGTHTTAAKWLKALCALEIIQETKKG